MPGIEETNLGFRQIALIGFGAGREEERIITAPDRQQIRPMLAEIGLETGVERDVAGIIEHQVELDLVRFGSLHVPGVERYAVGRYRAKGSLSAAGRALNVPVATLSRKISDLEALLGTQLLIRTTRKLTLTDAGVIYVAAARRIVEQVDEAEREATGEFTAPKGELVVTAPILYGRLHVLPVVADFLALFPEINIRFVLADRNVHLVDDHVDMAVRIGKLPDSAMVATRIGSMRTVVCASPTLLAGHGVPQTPHDLERLPCITVDTPMPFTG